jgi:uncharacterized protein
MASSSRGETCAGGRYPRGMPTTTEVFELATLSLTAGEARRFSLEVEMGDLRFGGQSYSAVPDRPQVTIDVSRTTGRGYALRLRFETTLSGPCMRCLADARQLIGVDAREVDQPGGGDDLTSPYVDGELLAVGAWAHDALALATPDQVLCRPDCAGLCPVCGTDLSEAGPEHAHERAPDPRWAKLRELR